MVFFANTLIYHLSMLHQQIAFIALCVGLLFANSAFTLEIFSPWVQGGMILGKTNPDNRLAFLNRSVRISPTGDFVLGLGRDAPEQVSLLETWPNGNVIEHSFTVQKRQYQEQHIDGVPARTVNTPKEFLPRIQREANLVRSARELDSDLHHYRGNFIWPAKGVITGVYGSRRVYNGQPRRPHYGVDIAAPEGTEVVSPASGTVLLVHQDMFYSGGTLIVDHGHGITSTFIHLSSIEVQEGDTIEQGQLIARIGSSGRATGPHLDWRINWFDQRLDPQLLISTPPQTQ